MLSHDLLLQAKLEPALFAFRAECSPHITPAHVFNGTRREDAPHGVRKRAIGPTIIAAANPMPCLGT